MKHILLTYCAENEALASEIIGNLSNEGLNFVKDSRQANEIDAVNQLLQNQPTMPVVILVTDNFLKSLACMNQFGEYLKAVEGRAMVIVADGAYSDGAGGVRHVPTEFTSINEVMFYRDFWYERWINLRKQKAALPEDQQASFEESINVAQKTSTTAGSYLRSLRDIKPIRIEMFKTNNYQALFDRFGLDHQMSSRNGESGDAAIQEIINVSEPLDFNETVDSVSHAPIEEVVVPTVENTTTEDLSTEGFEVLQSKVSDEDEPVVPTLVAETSNDDLTLPAGIELMSADDLEDNIENDGSTPEGEDEDIPAISNNYLETVTREMEKAAKIIKELDDTDEPETIATPEVTAPEVIVEAPVEAPVQVVVETPAETPQDVPTVEVTPAAVPLETAIEWNEEENDDFLPTLTNEHPVQKADRLYDHYLKNTPADEKAAITLLEEIVSLDNIHDEALLHLAYLQENAKNYERARDYYQRALALRPTDAEAFYRAAKLISERFAFDQTTAATYVKTAVGLDEDNATYQYEYALILRDHFKKDKLAAKHFKRVTELQPNNAQAHLALADLYLSAFDNTEAAKASYLLALSSDSSLQTAALDERFGTLAPAPVESANAATSEVNTNPNSSTLVLITGATSGIGKATATMFAKKGTRLILCGRREERLDAIAEEFKAQYNTDVHTLVFDVRNQADVQAAIQSLPENFQAIDILINNAGLAKGFSPIHEGELDHWEQMIDTNVKGLLYVTRAITPGMVARGAGQIVNIGSTAGKEVYANGNVYCGTKFAVDALSKAMRMDLFRHGIRVSSINPGHTEETEFALVRFDGDSDKAAIYNDFQPLKSSDVANVIDFIVSQPAYVTIQDITLASTQQANVSMIDRSGR